MIGCQMAQVLGPRPTVKAATLLKCLAPLPFRGTVKRTVSDSQPSFKLSATAQNNNSTRQEAIAVAALAEAADEPTVYFEPFLRSFILGLSAGAAFEAIHVAAKLWSHVSQGGLPDFMDALPHTLDRFAPVLVSDHIVAVGTMLLLYVIEAVAVVKILEQHQQNPDAAAKALQASTTLPKLMLPRLHVFRQLLNPARLFSSRALKADSISRPQATLEKPPVLSPPSKPVSEPAQIPPVYQPRQIPPILDPRQEPEGPDDTESQTPLQKQRAASGLKPGQMDPKTAKVLHREQELLERRMVMKNFWYAAGISEQVQDKPVPVEILGEKLVLVRGSDGVLTCLQNVCPHRGAPLHMGWMENMNGHDCIICPYHGWGFSVDGRLREVPASENSKDWPEKPLIESYPVQERGGFVWLFYGSRQMPVDERPPIPLVPELDDPAWRAVYGEIEFDCNHWSVFENAIDMAHIHYLHDGSFGNQERPQIKDITCKNEAFSVSGDFTLHNKPVNALWEFSKVPEVRVHAKAFLPSTSVITFTLGRGLTFTTFVNTVPISATKTINRFALVRRLDVDRFGARFFNLKIWDHFARSAMIKILSEDKAMVEKLAPEMIGSEISVKPDLVQIAFRALRRSYMKMGYGVDLGAKRVAQTKDM